MDRRQQKTRAAIFDAFSTLLAKKSYSKITVQEIIDTANVGRTTFYAHFETKDDLLKALCEDLFGHIISSALDCTHTHGLYSDRNAPESVFCHLLQHLQEDENNILELLSCESSELFLRYFKSYLEQLFADRLPEISPSVPKDFILNHYVSSFAEAVQWWAKRNMELSPEQVVGYYMALTAR